MSAPWDEEAEWLHDQTAAPPATLAEAHSHWHQQQAAGHIDAHAICPLDCGPDTVEQDDEPAGTDVTDQGLQRSPYAYLAREEGLPELVKICWHDRYVWEDASLSDSVLVLVTHGNGAESLVERHRLQEAPFVVNGLDLSHRLIEVALGCDISQLTHTQQQYLTVLLAPTFDPAAWGEPTAWTEEQLVEALQRFDGFGGPTFTPLDSEAVADRVQSWRNTVLGENWVSFELDRDDDGINGFTMGVFVPDLNMHLTKWNDGAMLRPNDPGLLGALEVAETISTTYLHVLMTALDSGLIHEVTNSFPTSQPTCGTEDIDAGSASPDRTSSIPF
jgi:hypothetical protein